MENAANTEKPMQEIIDLIYKNKDELKNILCDNNHIWNQDRVFFSNNPTYIGIEISFDKNISATLILINGGIWQYRFTNTTPHTHSYVTAYNFLEYIKQKINNYENKK